MEKYRTFELDEALLVAGNSIATNQTISDIKTLRTRAYEAQSALDDIEIKDVYDFGCVDELVRLKRNAAALATLLSMAADAAEYVKYGIHAIFQARGNAFHECGLVGVDRANIDSLAQVGAHAPFREEGAPHRGGIGLGNRWRFRIPDDAELSPGSVLSFGDDGFFIERKAL